MERRVYIYMFYIYMYVLYIVYSDLISERVIIVSEHYEDNLSQRIKSSTNDRYSW